MDQILQFLHSLYGLPGYALAAIACLVMGWACKISKWFPNPRIPLIVLPFGSLMNYLLAMPRTPDQPLRLYIMQHIVIGALIGALSWLLHDQVLRHIEDKIPLLGNLLKTDDVVTPPAPTPPEPPKP